MKDRLLVWNVTKHAMDAMEMVLIYAINVPKAMTCGAESAQEVKNVRQPTHPADMLFISDYVLPLVSYFKVPPGLRRLLEF